MPPVDPLTLEPESSSLHQLATFVPWSDSLAESLEQSPLFTVHAEGNGLRAEWMATSPDEPVLYPLGRVTLYRQGLLLEGFAESRIHELTRHVDQLSSLRVTADETRAFRLEELLQSPANAMHPLEEAAGRTPTAHDVACWYLRAAWSFQPCAELDGRTPHTVAQTGRGRKQIAEVLEELGPDLRRRYRDFPPLDAEELRALLLPKVPDTTPASDKPGTRRSPRRA